MPRITANQVKATTPHLIPPPRTEEQKAATKAKAAATRAANKEKKRADLLRQPTYINPYDDASEGDDSDSDSHEEVTEVYSKAVIEQIIEKSKKQEATIKDLTRQLNKIKEGLANLAS